MIDRLFEDSPGSLAADYAAMAPFAEEYRGISYIRFSNYIVSGLSLFVVHEDFDFDALDGNLQRIASAMPAMIRIFERPLIHLREIDEIVPIEAVTHIDEKTVRHAGGHSDLWDGEDMQSLRPVRLLTRKYEDNYSIYENRVFAETVDQLMTYLRRNMRTIGNLLYSGKILEFNLLERNDHVKYLFALSKLHTGYVRNFDKYYETAERQSKTMQALYSALESRLKYAVYRKNRKRHGKVPLHSTNILMMHKDYHRMFTLKKHLGKISVRQTALSGEEIAEFKENYGRFCSILFCFAAEHFDFASPEDAPVDVDALDNSFSFGEWSLHVKKARTGDLPALDVCVSSCLGTREYRMLLLCDAPNVYGESSPEKPEGYDEQIILSPLGMGVDTVFVSITDINSFRRLQQLLLRGMVRSALPGGLASCPFCGGKIALKEEEGESFYRCPTCRTVIRERRCALTGESYPVTGIDLFKPRADDSFFHCDDPSEKLHYRNVTPITEEGEIICPICHKVHEQ